MAEKKAPLRSSARAKLQDAQRQLPIAGMIDEIPLQDLSHLADQVDTQVKQVTTSFTDDFTLRELRGLDKALQTIRGELVHNVAKLSELDGHIAMEERKLGETSDEGNKKLISRRLQNLKDERAALHVLRLQEKTGWL